MKFICLYLLLIPCQMFSQITGKLVDAESNNPIPAAAIMMNGSVVTTSDEQGHFFLDSQQSKSILVVTHAGYKSYSDTIPPFIRQITIRLTPNPHQLSEIVVSASMREQKLKLLTGNDVLLTHSDLENSNEITLSGYLNQAPGVYMQQGALNTNRLIIRGVGSRSPYGTNRIKAYFDEIPITEGDGSTTVEDLDLADISRIEILKGPSSALYGSGLGGVVKFYPAGPENNNQLSVQTGAGSFGTFKNTLTSALKDNQNALTTIFSNVYSDGFRQNSRYKRSSASFFGSHHGVNSNLKVIMNYIDVNSRIASSIDEKTFDETPELAAKNWLAIKGFENYSKWMTGLTYSSEFSKHFLHQTTIFTNYTDHYESRPFNILSDKTFNYGLRDRITLSTIHHTVNIGFEWFNEYYNWKIFQINSGQQGPLTDHNKENRNYINVFGLWSWNVTNKLSVETGLNFNSLGYKLTDLFEDSLMNSGSYRFKPILSPRLGINYQLTPNINLYSSAGHGFSAPSLEETLLPDGQPNPDLKPEEGYNFDLGVRISLLEHRLYADITHYNMLLRNLLVTKRLSEDTFTGENAGKTNHQGIEILVKYSPLPEGSGLGTRPGIDFSLSVTESENRFKSFADTAGDYSGKKLPGIPSEMVNFNTYVSFPPAWRFYINYQFLGSQYLTDDNSKKYGSYKLIGMKTQYDKLLLRNFTLSLYAGVQNLMNEKYASMVLVNALPTATASPRYYYPGNPRSFYTGIKIQFGK